MERQRVSIVLAQLAVAAAIGLGLLGIGLVLHYAMGWHRAPATESNRNPSPWRPPTARARLGGTKEIPIPWTFMVGAPVG